MLAHQEQCHYTEGPQRWQGIHQHLIAAHGHFPDYSDCSASATWILWNGLFVPFGVHDIVNGLNWGGGYTGTILQHGKIVHLDRHLEVGDLIVYGIPGTTGKHVAVYMGGGYVFSQGSEGGPYKLPMYYRKDVMARRRFI